VSHANVEIRAWGWRLAALRIERGVQKPLDSLIPRHSHRFVSRCLIYTHPSVQRRRGMSRYTFRRF
jgi:hypothetical protein